MNKLFIIIFIIFFFVLISPDICNLVETFETKNARLKTVSKQLNVNNQLLEIYDENPQTGICNRDSYCNTGEYDKEDMHTVCAKMTKNFLILQNQKEMIYQPQINNFPGLKPGDNWCLCALRWAEAHNHDKGSSKVKLDATNMKTVYYIEKGALMNNCLQELKYIKLLNEY